MNDTHGVKLLTRLRVSLNHLKGHRFSYNFQNCVYPLCLCSLEVESTIYFFLHCCNYSNLRYTMSNTVKKGYSNTASLSESELVDLSKFGSSTFISEENANLLKASIKYIVNSERFSLL